MGATRNDFIKYLRTPHLFGAKGTDDDKHLGRKESERFTADPSLIVEEKLDGTNVGIHFTSRGRMVLQCRGHEITEGMHPQYDLFKQWTSVRRPVLEAMLGSRLILYGEWLYAKHSVHYLSSFTSNAYTRSPGYRRWLTRGELIPSLNRQHRSLRPTSLPAGRSLFEKRESLCLQQAVNARSAPGVTDLVLN